MKRDSLLEMLKEASGGKPKDDAFRFAADQCATMLVGAGAELLSIDRVARVTVRASYVLIETDRGERVFVDAEQIVAVRHEAGSETSGFLPRPG